MEPLFSQQCNSYDYGWQYTKEFCYHLCHTMSLYFIKQKQNPRQIVAVKPIFVSGTLYAYTNSKKRKGELTYDRQFYTKIT